MSNQNQPIGIKQRSVLDFFEPEKAAQQQIIDQPRPIIMENTDLPETTNINKRSILLVEPEKYKSWGSNQQHIGLLKIGAYHQVIGDLVEYVTYPNYPKKINRPDIIYVTSMFTYWYKGVWKTVQHYKDSYPKAKVILGGIYATLCPEHAKGAGADEIMIGQHPEAKIYPPNPLLIPESEHNDFAYCMTSQGCTGNCRFCATHILYGHGIYQRPVDEVVGEISLQYRRGINKIYFGDDDILYKSEEHLIPIINKLTMLGIKPEFYVYGGMQARWMTPQLAELFKNNRFKFISFGFESVSEEVLSKMNRKGLGGQLALDNALNYLRAVDFDLKSVMVFFMIGLPYQTEKDMIATLRYLVKQGVMAEPQRWAPIPGTADYNDLSDEIKKKDLEELYYKDFLAPGQNDEFLKKVKNAARYCNMGCRYSNINVFDDSYKGFMVD